jgi:phospholipid-binding lipoprotein MlaA
MQMLRKWLWLALGAALIGNADAAAAGPGASGAGAGGASPARASPAQTSRRAGAPPDAAYSAAASRRAAARLTRRSGAAPIAGSAYSALARKTAREGPGFGEPSDVRDFSDVGEGRESDPLEWVNRGFFALNDGVDVYVLEPTARGWRAVTPRFVRRAVEHFFSNLQFPVRFVGCLTQGELVASGSELGRFVLNSTVGLAGFLDPASRIGLQLHQEDLGQSLGTWGVGPGPYLVLPLLGPSSVRDLVDLPLSSATSFIPGLNVLNVVNTRAELIVEVREAKAASLDYYSFVRNAYLQRRRALVLNEVAVPQEAEDDLYELSDEVD